MNVLTGFIDFEKSQTKTLRGGIMMYDVKGHYKYLSAGELFDYYLNHIK